MKLNDEFLVHKISGETLLVPTAQAPFHGLGQGNDTVKNNTTEEKIVDALAEKYDGSRDEMAEDVRSVISKLRKIGAIVE